MEYKGIQIGRRIHVMGNSCSGKSTLASRLSKKLDIPFVELDALNWQPNWVGLHEKDPAELERLIKEATASESWVVAGSYISFSQPVFWSRLQTVIWLDLPMHQLVWRMCFRSWRRWRAKELLWGTNYEDFWSQFKIWRQDESLLWWIVSQHKKKQRDMASFRNNPKWKHIHFLQLPFSTDVDSFCKAMELKSI